MSTTFLKRRRADDAGHWEATHQWHQQCRRTSCCPLLKGDAWVLQHLEEDGMSSLPWFHVLALAGMQHLTQLPRPLQLGSVGEAANRWFHAMESMEVPMPLPGSLPA
jgi:hypothetical protein